MGAMHFDDDYQGEGTPLSDTSRTIIIVIHYSVFPAVGFAIYALMKNIHVLQERIWSPFLLMTTLTWLQMAAAFEIANHFYVDNWQIYDPQSDLINGSFSFFNFGAQNLLALSLRKKDLTFYRKGSGIADWFCIIWDPVMAALIVLNPILYGVLGRSTSVTALSPLALICGLITLFRTWKNLGPNVYTKIGGIGFFVLAMTGVIMLAVYNATDLEWIHGLIGGSFIASTIPLSIAFWNAQLQDESPEESPEEESGKQEVEIVEVKGEA